MKIPDVSEDFSKTDFSKKQISENMVVLGNEDIEPKSMVISFEKCKWYEDGLESACYKKIVEKVLKIFYEKIQNNSYKSDLNILNIFKKNNLKVKYVENSGNYVKYFASLSEDINITEIPIGNGERFMYFVIDNTFYVRAVLNKHT